MADPVLTELARPASDDDVIAGLRPRFVASPASTDEASAVVRAAAADGLAVGVRGAATKQDWALPPRRLDLVIDTSRLSGVVEHAAGDLVAVVRAGTRLSSLAGKLATAGQQLALDTPYPQATIGGTVAVNVSGPRRMLYGSVRDLLIGVTVVRPDGVVARSGGKVVKNVAGYDLGKLLTGSYGTLGMITECAFRLHPIPPARAYAVRRAPLDVAGTLLATVRHSQAAPSAVEVDLASKGEVEIAVLIEGTASGVAQRAAAVATSLGGEVLGGEVLGGEVLGGEVLGGEVLGGDVSEAPAWFGAYPWRSGEIGVKLTAPLSRVPALLATARDHGIPARGSAGAGVLYANLTPAADPAAALAALRRVAEHAVVLTAPAEVRDTLDVWGPVPGLALMRRIKEQFDPGARFAPGRFVGGI